MTKPRLCFDVILDFACVINVLHYITLNLKNTNTYIKTLKHVFSLNTKMHQKLNSLSVVVYNIREQNKLSLKTYRSYKRNTSHHVDWLRQSSRRAHFIGCHCSASAMPYFHCANSKRCQTVVIQSQRPKSFQLPMLTVGATDTGQ